MKKGAGRKLHKEREKLDKLVGKALEKDTSLLQTRKIMQQSGKVDRLINETERERFLP